MPTFRISEAFTDATSADENDSLIREVMSDIVSDLSVGLATRVIAESYSGHLHGLAEAVTRPYADAVHGLAEAVTRPYADLLGPSKSAFWAVIKTALGPSFDMMNKAMAVNFAGLISENALGSISPFGFTDLYPIFEKLSALAQQESVDEASDRERVRQLWGCYVYVQVWIICLLVLLGAWRINEDFSALLGIGLTMKGCSGDSVASKAREIALDRFDRTYPLGSNMPAITSVLI